MADIKFNCPRCGQKIALDELWAGQQLQCPACADQLTVPARTSAVPPAATAAPPPAPVPTYQSPPPPPVPASAPKLSIGRGQTAHTPGALPPTERAKPVFRDHTKPKEKGGAMKWLKIAGGAVVFCAAAYAGFLLISHWQEKLNAKRREAEKNADGGELGHIANVYSVLDATDPEKMGRSGGVRRQGVPRLPRAVSGKNPASDMDDRDDTAANIAEKDLPVLPAAWTLDLAAAKIPEGKANGTIAGTNFLVQTARLDVTPTALALRLIQGTPAAPERELIVYLHPKPGEKIGGGAWRVTKDQKAGGTVPQIAKRWKTNPKFAPTTKSFPTGYAMKLEFGAIRDGFVSGKIFLALPDPEQTVVAGIFKAATTLPDTALTATPAAPTPVTDSRYGERPAK